MAVDSTHRPTTADIQKLLGRPLDILAAELVMHWPHAGDNDPFRWYKANGGLILSTGPEIFPTGRGIIPTEWRPTWRLGDAWRLVEKLCLEERAWYEMSYRPTGAVANFTGCAKYQGAATFDECGKDRESCQALAIVRAALIARVCHMI